ncbi:MAG TPA: FxLYD domain-containing protein [Planctomycetota bacterium]|nr:FxLYD domain-containing protein [Planctomycetota bacterium]
MKSASFAVLLFVFSSIAFAANEPAEDTFKLSGWTVARERKTVTGSNRVTASVNVKNVSKAPVSDVSVTLTYATGLGEKVFEPITQKIGALKAGESAKVTFVAELVPVFQSYTIAINYNGTKKEDWFGNSDAAQPESKNTPAKGEANVVILGKEASVDKNGTFNGTIHVKNEGTEAASNMKIFVTFFDLRKNKIKDWNATLGDGTLAAGAERNIPFTMPNAPKIYGSYSIRLNSDDAPPEAALSGGDFSNVEDVEFAHFKFTHIDPKSSSYKVEVQCRNGLKATVEHVKLEMIFYGPRKREVKRFTHEVPGAIAAGEIKTLAFEIPGLPAYEEYEQRVAYSKSSATPAVAPATGKAKFQNKPDVEVIFNPLTVNVDKVVEISGAVRNGKNVHVKDVAIHMTLLKADGSTLTTVDRNLPAQLSPGQEREITVYVENATNAANYTFTFKFSEIK